jgi:hypothetical protein
MPLKTLSFLRARPANVDQALDINTKNWKVLADGTRSFIKSDLSIDNPVGTPTVGQAAFVFLGPIVYLTIEITLDTNDGWGGASQIRLPVEHLNVNSTNYLQPIFQVYVPTTGAMITTAYMGTSFYLQFTGDYTYTGAGAQQVRIQGWFYRN